MSIPFLFYFFGRKQQRKHDFSKMLVAVLDVVAANSKIQILVRCLEIEPDIGYVELRMRVKKCKKMERDVRAVQMRYAEGTG